MSFALTIASTALFKLSTLSLRSRLWMGRTAVFIAALLLAAVSIAAPVAPKPSDSSESAPIPQIIIIGKRMTPEQKRQSLEAEQRAEKAAAARAQAAPPSKP